MSVETVCCQDLCRDSSNFAKVITLQFYTVFGLALKFTNAYFGSKSNREMTTATTI
jgi:hypothetical protein